MNNKFDNSMEMRTRLIRVHQFVRDSFMIFCFVLFVLFFFSSVFTTFSMKVHFIFHFSFLYIYTNTANYYANCFFSLLHS